MPATPPDQTPPLQDTKIVKFGIFLTFVVLFLFISRFIHYDIEGFKSLFLNLDPFLAGLAYISLYVGITSLIWVGSKNVFRIAGAYVFGAYVSTLLVWIAELIQSAIFFTLARMLGRDFVESRMKGRMHKIDEIIDDTGFWSIFFIRFSPIVPFLFADLGFGLTKVSFKKYFTACVVGSPFRIFFVQFFLSLGTEYWTNPLKLTDYLAQNPAILAVAWAYMIASIVVFVLMIKKYKESRKAKFDQVAESNEV